jgi:hypothetical protein
VISGERAAEAILRFAPGTGRQSLTGDSGRETKSNP